MLNTKFSHAKGTLAVEYAHIAASAPTIIFLHDSLGCIETWRDFPKQLAQAVECNYLIYDRLGYGASPEDPNALKRGKGYLEAEAEVLLELIEEFAIDRPVLFGHSDGGSIALLAAAKKADSIRGIIVEAAHIFVEEVTLSGIRKVMQDYPVGRLKQKLTKYHGAKAETVFHAWANTWLDESFRDWNIESFLPNIVCPCLIIQGKADEYGSLAQVTGIQRGIRGAVSQAVLDEVGHTPHREDPATLIELTKAFLQKYIKPTLPKIKPHDKKKLYLRS